MVKGRQDFEVRIEDVPVDPKGAADNVYEKVGNTLKVVHPSTPVACIDKAQRKEPEYKSYIHKKKCLTKCLNVCLQNKLWWVRIVSYMHRIFFMGKSKI